MELITRWSWLLAVAGLALLAGSASTWFLLGTIAGPATSLWIAGTILIALWTALDRARIGEEASTRSFRLASGSLALNLLALLVAVGFQALVDARLDKTWDLTNSRQNALSEQTLKVLAGLEEPVTLTAFFRNDSPEGMAFSRLGNLMDEASDQLTVRYVDPVREPVQAERFKVLGETIVLQQADREQRLELDFDEANLAKKLVLVQSTVEHKICWSVGHGEADPDDARAPDGYGAAVVTLEGLNYQVMNTLTATQGIERDCEVLMVVRPRTDWLPYEREALAAYLAEGGQVFLMLDPIAQTPGLTADLQRFGVKVRDDVVFDDDPRVTMADLAGTLALWGDHLVTHETTMGLGAVVFSVTRSMEFSDPEGLVSRPLFRTSEQAWGETDLQSPDIGPNEGVDAIGELEVGGLVTIVDPSHLDIVRHVAGPVGGEPGVVDLQAELGRLVPADFAPKTGGRLYVLGDADLASNKFLQTANNRDLFLNVVAFLVGEEDQLGERPKEADTFELTDFSASLLCLVSTVFLPGFCVLFAVVLLLRRRKL